MSKQMPFIKLEGVQHIARALDRLPIEVRATAEKSALRAGGKPILNAAKAMCPVGENGLLKKSIGLTVRKNRSGALRGQFTLRVGPRTGFAIVKGVRSKGKNAGKPIRIDPSKYGHLVELGTSHSAAKPFIRPAIDSASSQVVAAMAQGYAKGLERAVKKIQVRFSTKK